MEAQLWIPSSLESAGPAPKSWARPSHVMGRLAFATNQERWKFEEQF